MLVRVRVQQSNLPALRYKGRLGSFVSDSALRCWLEACRMSSNDSEGVFRWSCSPVIYPREPQHASILP